MRVLLAYAGHMIVRTLTIALALMSPALAQDVPPVAPPPPAEVSSSAVPPKLPANTLPTVSLATTQGPIIIALETAKAPLTTANFLRYVTQKRLDGTSFYRALRFPGENAVGLIQGGIHGSSKLILPPVAHESTAKTGLTHDDMAISMARTTPGTAAGDFFIIVGNLPSLDAKTEGAGEKGDDRAGYAVFGHVIGGQDIVRRIIEAPTSPTAGEGAMKGQILLKPVTIISAKASKLK